jgi:hypothetical protein
MPPDDLLIDAARTIRRYLGDLVGPRAGDFDTQIAAHLQRYLDGAEAAGEMRNLLLSDEATGEWLAEFLDDPAHLPPEFQPVRSGGFRPLPGGGNPQPPPKWACPVDGNYVVYQHSSQDPIERCPEHHIDLVLVG